MRTPEVPALQIPRWCLSLFLSTLARYLSPAIGVVLTFHLPLLFDLVEPIVWKLGL